MQLIYTHDNIAVVQSVKNVLTNHGIESFVKNEHSVAIGARHGINNTFIELWLLHDQDLVRAAAIIESEVENPDSGESWTCPSCQEENEGAFAFCWNCQQAREKE